VQDVSAIAVLFQAAGSLLLGVVIAQLAQIFSSGPARWWSAAWFFFAAALFCVWLLIGYPTMAATFAYLLLQWVSLYLMWCGCRELTGRTIPNLRIVLYVLPAAIAIAFIILRSSDSFNEVFIVQAAIVCLLLLASVVELARTVGATRGILILRVSLAVLASIYAAYVPLFLIHTRMTPIPFLSYSSFGDLLVSVFVGCTMVLVIAEMENRRAKDNVSELEQARSVIEQRLHTDALTEAFSRHAFHWMKKGDEIATDGMLTGVVVMIDIDELKQINDNFGHDAGDTAIRAVANALRGVIRSDDLLFRWGGDEFLAILPNLPEPVVIQRLSVFEQPIPVRLDDGRQIGCRISCGYAEFGTRGTMDEAIQIADQRMYEGRSIARDDTLN
jgi:diguanylate cyclase (GGDEF)-like protein